MDYQVMQSHAGENVLGITLSQTLKSILEHFFFLRFHFKMISPVSSTQIR